MVALKEIPATESDLSDEIFEFDPLAPMWSDLTPIPQEDGPDPLCPILYDPECTLSCLTCRLQGNGFIPGSSKPS